MTVVFLNRSRKYGAKSVVGPVTGISYLIGPEGAPVSALDADVILGMTEPPCCGESLPFDGRVRSFGVHVPTPDQLKQVPDYLWDAEPKPGAVKAEPKRAKLYEEYVEPEEEEPAKVQGEEFDYIEDESGIIWQDEEEEEPAEESDEEE